MADGHQPRPAASGRAAARVAAWRPAVPGVTEVFHARFVDHAYPAHTHDAWTLLIVDDGAIRFDLDHRQHGTVGSMVTVLPPHVPHDGRAATEHGFRKRVIYLEPRVLGDDMIGWTAREPSLDDEPLRYRIHQLHQALTHPGDALEAESRLSLIGERLRQRLANGSPQVAAWEGPGSAGALAARLRELLDATVVDGITLDQAGHLLGAHPTHLVRSFTRRYGLPPHAYLTGRRVDLARRLLLDGHPPAGAAVAAGFYDQAHLTRTFARYLGTTPGRYLRPGHDTCGLATT